MRELNIFERIIHWLRSLFVSKEKERENSDKIKREMCKRAFQSREPFDDEEEGEANEIHKNSDD